MAANRLARGLHSLPAAWCLHGFRRGLHPGQVDIRRKTFVAETTSKLEFLLHEHGFAGPEVIQHDEYPLVICVSYHRSELDVEETLILSYGGEEYVTTSVAHSTPTPGSAKRTEIAADTAHTGFQMRRALDRHARELHKLLTKKQPDSRPA